MLVFDARAHAPLLIPVPIDIHSDTQESYDDLDMEMWIPWPARFRNVIDLTETRFYVDYYPKTGEPLPFPCTVYFEDQQNEQEDNKTVQELFGLEGWKGNLIVMRNTDADTVTNMLESDFGVAQEVLKQCVENQHFLIIPLITSFPLRSSILVLFRSIDKALSFTSSTVRSIFGVSRRNMTRFHQSDCPLL